MDNQFGELVSSMQSGERQLAEFDRVTAVLTQDTVASLFGSGSVAGDILDVADESLPEATRILAAERTAQRLLKVALPHEKRAQFGAEIHRVLTDEAQLRETSFSALYLEHLVSAMIVVQLDRKTVQKIKRRSGRFNTMAPIDLLLGEYRDWARRRVALELLDSVLPGWRETANLRRSGRQRLSTDALEELPAPDLTVEVENQLLLEELLSPREHQVWDAREAGLTGDQVALRLNIKPATVRVTERNARAISRS